MSYFPRGPNQTPDQTNPQGLVQLALAVRQQKQQEAHQKKQDAMSKLDSLVKNPQLLMMMDPNDVEKTFTDAGYKLASGQQITAQTIQQAQQTAQGGAGGGSMNATGAFAPPPVPTNDIEQLGKTTQGPQAGAQAASPPNASAAAKAPGGGVTPGGIVTPGTGQIDQLKQGAVQTAQNQYGALAPLYGAAQTQLQAQQYMAQKQMEIDELGSRAAGGDPAALGTLMMLNGHNVNDSDIRVLALNSNDPQVRKQVFDFALGNETPVSKAARMDNTVKTLMSSSEFMERVNPADVPRIAQSIVNGNGMPAGVKFKELTAAQQTDVTKNALELMKQGFSGPDAMNAANAQAQGIPYALSLPKGMQGMTTSQMDALSRQKLSSADLVRAEGESAKAMEEAKQIDAKMGDAPEVWGELQKLVDMHNAKITPPADYEETVMKKVSAAAGMPLENVRHWYKWLWAVPSLEAAPMGTGPKQGGQPDLGKGMVSSQPLNPDAVEGQGLQAIGQGLQRLATAP